MDKTPPVMQRHGEHNRVTVPGRRTDNGERCTLLVVHERVGGCWAFYPHGAAQLGVRVEPSGAMTVAETIMASAR